MPNSTITYDRFDEICEFMSDETTVRWYPSPEEIVKASEIGIGLFLSLAGGSLIAEEDHTPNEKESIVKINKTIMEKVEFTEEDNKAGEEKIEIPAGTYISICNLVSKPSVKLNGWFPSMEQIDTFFVPNIDYVFGLMIALLISGDQRNHQKETLKLKDLLRSRFEVTGDRNAVCITTNKFSRLQKELLFLEDKRDSWWPTQEEINTFLRPNFGKCYDYILWLLQKKEEASPANIQSVELLEKLLDENLVVLNRRCDLWF